MNITIKTVEVSKPAGKKYEQAEVIYKNDRGETQTKKLFSFTNPQVFSTVKEAKQDEVFTITQVKNDKGYWDWTSITKGEVTASPPRGTVSTGPTRSGYETPEERAAKQVLIVKQNALTNAVNFYGRSQEDDLEVRDVLEVAQQFAEWVLDNEKVKTEELGDIPY